MTENISVTCEGGCAKVSLSGRLDATSAPELQEKLKELFGQKVEKLVFFANDLEYISSAGLRVIIFAKQKIGVDAKVYFIGGQDAVINVIKMSGLDNFMDIQSTFGD